MLLSGERVMAMLYNGHMTRHLRKTAGITTLLVLMFGCTNPRTHEPTNIRGHEPTNPRTPKPPNTEAAAEHPVPPTTNPRTHEDSGPRIHDEHRPVTNVTATPFEMRPQPGRSPEMTAVGWVIASASWTTANTPAEVHARIAAITKGHAKAETSRAFDGPLSDTAYSAAHSVIVTGTDTTPSANGAWDVTVHVEAFAVAPAERVPPETGIAHTYTLRVVDGTVEAVTS